MGGMGLCRTGRLPYAVKGSRYCAGRPMLANAGEGIERFLAQGMSRLGDKLGPIMLMLAVRRKIDRENIARFLNLLPR